MSVIVKHGDKYDVTFTANADLTGATTRLLARRKYTGDVIELSHTVTDPTNAVVTHTLTGDLPVGRYDIELEVTRGDELVSFPSVGYESLVVTEDLN